MGVLCLRLAVCLALLMANVGFAQVPSPELEQPPLVSDPAPVNPEVAPPLVSPEVAPPPVSPEPEQVPIASEPVPAAPSAPPGELIPYNYQPTVVPPDQVLPRVLSEAFGGVLGGVGLGLVGLLAGVSALESADCSTHDNVCAVTVLALTIPAVFVGIPLGVQVAGEGQGGRGQFLPTLAGTVLGTGAGLIYGLTSEGTAPLVVGLIVGPLLGSIVGYELSNAVVRSRSPAFTPVSSAATKPQVLPVIGATPRGGFLGGLAGTF